MINMKKNTLQLLLSCLFLMGANAQAQEYENDTSCLHDESCAEEPKYYASLLAGANFLQNTDNSGNSTTYQTGYTISTSFGYRCPYDLRLEGEYAYRRNAIKRIQFIDDDTSRNGHFQTSSFMANLLWDLPLCSWECSLWNIQPYIGAGIGYDFHQMHASNPRIIFTQKWHHFAWQLMTGVSCPVYCNTELYLEYKFHQGGNHFYNHTIGVGINYNFDFF